MSHITTAVFSLITLIFLTCCTDKPAPETTEKALPNIVLILADDLGYGDISALNANSKISTPTIDALVNQGIAFTDAHSNSSVCTPTRYGLLTGEYAWRSRMKQGVLLGYSPSLIPHDKPTMASMLAGNGYYTACIGKWHLGLDWKLIDGSYLTFAPGKTIDPELVRYNTYDSIDFQAPVKGGPESAGFDYSYILPASLDFEPYCYLENNLLEDPLDAETEGSDLDTGYTGAFWRPGKMSSTFVHHEVLPRFIDKGVNFIKSREQQKEPFFLYLPLAAPHTPWLPTEPFKDKSQAGVYGDFVQMVDHEVGRIMEQLKASGFDENTLVIFTSDNGAYWKDDFIENFQHRSNYHFRGMKADIFEGGHRIPLIVKWPGLISEGTTSDQTVCMTDIFSTIQQLVGDQSSAGKDSYSFDQILTGEATTNNRPPVIHHSSRGMFAIRSGDWKLIEGLGSGGFSEPVTIPVEEGMPEGQLYNLDTDRMESDNRYLEEKSLVDSLMLLLNLIKSG